MVTSQDIINVRFDKSFRGYSTRQVDDILSRAASQLEDDEKKIEELNARIEEQKEQIRKMDKILERYEADGDILKSALINAQRMGENVIREANQKSDDIIHRANLRSDDIIRDANDLLQRANARAEEMIGEAEEQRTAELQEYDRIRMEVTRFKADVLNLYRSHVESLSSLPEYQPVLPESEEPAAQPEEDTAAQEREEFWEKDENELKAVMPLEDAPADESDDTDSSAFQGAPFSE